MLAAARAHARFETRRVRARARAPRLQPSVRSCLRWQSATRRYRILLPAGGSVRGASAAQSQEDKLQEDVWAREYCDGGGGGERAGVECGRKTVRWPAPPGRPFRSLAPGRRPRPPPRPAPPPAHTRGREAGRGRAPVSEGAGAGREQPPVRLETVATATGLRSPATRLQGGDAPSYPSHPSPIPSGASASGRRGRGDTRALPLVVEGTSPLWPVWVCLPPQTVEGGGGGRAPHGHDLAPTWLQSSQQGFWSGCKRGGVLACRGRRSHEGWVRGLCPAIPTVATTTRLRNDVTQVGCPRGMFLTRREERSSHPSSSWLGHVPNAAWAGGGSLLSVPSHRSPGWGGSSVGRGRGKDIADPGKLKPGPDGSAPAHCLDHKCPFFV